MRPRKRRTHIVLGILAGAILWPGPGAAATDETTTTALPPAQPSTPVCDRQCEIKNEYGKLRRATDRNPTTPCIVTAESEGKLHAGNRSGAGGRYQILPSTWAQNLPGKRFVRVAQSVEHHFRRLGHDEGPQWSGRLLQDKVAGNIVASSGLGPWTQFDGC